MVLDDTQCNDEGFLLDYSQWSKEVALQLAAQDDLQLTEPHWEIIEFIRHYYIEYRHLPNARVFVKAVRKALGEEKGNSRYLQKLFPKGPLKYACKCAGLPKPPTCL